MLLRPCECTAGRQWPSSRRPAAWRQRTAPSFHPMAEQSTITRQSSPGRLPQNRAGPASIRRQGRLSMTEPHVLLALADETLHEPYRQMLDIHGYQVEIASGGVECLLKLCKF